MKLSFYEVYIKAYLQNRIDTTAQMVGKIPD